MVTSRTIVHPLPLEVAAPPPPEGVEQPPPDVVLDYSPGMPGTRLSLGLRMAQSLLAGIALSVMCSTRDFWSVDSFRYARSPFRSATACEGVDTLHNHAIRLIAFRFRVEYI